MFSDVTQRRAEFASIGQAPQSFPPPDIQPHTITTLGQLICTQQDGANRLLVLGGHGNSGSMASGFGNPKIEHYANNDAWFDDVSDGPVTAQLVYDVLKISGYPAPSDTPPGSNPRNMQPSLQAGLEPGDITKYDAVPWQADFNECGTQDIDVN